MYTPIFIGQSRFREVELANWNTLEPLQGYYGKDILELLLLVISHHVLSIKRNDLTSIWCNILRKFKGNVWEDI